jgi:hypothetical protein
MNNIQFRFETSYGYDFVQFVILDDGRKFAITGQMGVGFAISPRYTIYVKKKSDLKEFLDRAVKFDGYVLKDNYTDNLELQTYENHVLRFDTN